MADLRQLEYFVLRYVPDGLKQEFVNFGLVMRELNPVGVGFADLRLTNDWEYLLYHDPQADLEWLAALGRDFRQQLKDPDACEMFLKRVEESSSNLIQFSPKQVYLAAEPEKELDRLAHFLLDRMKFAAERNLTGRQKLKNSMASQFEGVGVGELVRDLPIAVYAKYRYKLDFGYRIGETLKFFQALSLKTNMDQGVRILARYPKIAGEISQEMQLRPVLTAVVDDDLDRSGVETQFMLGALEEKSIRIAAVAEMPLIAELARKELRA